jgi:nucleoside-diphosphate-sugar epimerase
VLESAAAPGFALPGLFTGRVEVVGDAGGVGPRVASRLAAAGVDAHAVDRATPEASGIVFARGLLPEDATQDDGIAVQRAALEAARVLAHRERREGETRLFVTLQDTGGDFGASGRAGERAWGAGLPGLVKTASAEWAGVAVKAIDVAATGPSPDAVAERVVAELLQGGREVEVALRADGTRAVYRHRAAPYRPGATHIARGAVIVVSGGARGVTATSLAALGKYGPKLALLGRTALVDESPDTLGAKTDAELRRALMARATAAGAPPNPKEMAREAKLILDCREIRGNIAAIQRAGAEVSYHAVDVRSAADVRACVDTIRASWGPIQGIIHGAGVLADALVANQNDEQFDRVFGTKVDGLRHLLAATASDPVDLLLLFSSVAGRFGNSAQAVYSMANEVLAVVATHEAARRAGRGRPCLVRSLAWGPWDGGMVTPGLAKIFEKAGAKLIAIDVGAEALAREVTSADAAAQVVLMNGEPPLVGRPIHGGHVFQGEERFDVVVNASTAPEITGHRISEGGVPVIPAVLVVEWFFRAAKACFPGLAVQGARDLKVLRGVPVEDYDGRGVRLVVQARTLESTAAETALEMKLLDAQGKPRYAAQVRLGAHPAPAPTASSDDPPGSGDGATCTVAEAYRDALFHRPPFDVVRALDGLYDGRAGGELVGVRAAGWPREPWIADPAILDGGLQIAIVWSRHVLGGATLPTAIGSVDLYGEGPAEAPVRCVLRGERAGQRRVLLDLTFLGAEGRPIAALRGVEMHLPLAANGVKTNGAA